MKPYQRIAIFTLTVIIIYYYFVGVKPLPNTAPTNATETSSQDDKKPETANAVELLEEQTSKDVIQRQKKESSQNLIGGLFVKRDLQKIEFIPGIMEFLVKKGGNVDNLTISQKASLGKSLQLCGTIPKYNIDALEQRKNNIHFSQLPVETLSFYERMCRGVPDELIYESYSILERAASEGDLQSALLFYTAQAPELLKASMNNDYENIDFDKLKAEHNLKSNELLIDSVYNGSLQAAKMIAVETMFGGSGFKKDNKTSLGYFLAVNSIMKGTDLAKDIDNIKSNLNDEDIIEATEFAQELINHWQTLEGGIW